MTADVRRNTSPTCPERLTACIRVNYSVIAGASGADAGSGPAQVVELEQELALAHELALAVALKLM